MRRHAASIVSRLSPKQGDDPMPTVALILAIVALIVAYLALRRANQLDHKLSTTREEMSQVQAELREAGTRLEAGLREIRLDLRQQAGTLKFSPDMSIADALEMHPRVGELLESFQLGGCSNCAVSDVDTLEGACRSYGIDLAALMNALAALTEPTAPDSRATVPAVGLSSTLRSAY
jgi:hybrid cluster-associated redox disulfide protein